MNRRPIALLAALTLTAAACSGDGAATTTTTTSTTTSTTTTTVASGPAIPVDPSLIPDGDPDLLAALALFPDELPEPYAGLPLDKVESGYSPAGGSLASALEPADEADDIVRFGQVAEFATAYGDPDEVGVAFNAGQFATPEGASAYVEDWVEDLRSSAEDPSEERFVLRDFRSEELEGRGDQAIRIGYTSRLTLTDGSTRDRLGGAVAVRKDALVLWVWGNGPQAEEILDDFADLVTERVEAVADGTLPPRDYTTLGLTDPPTLALSSFAFEYSYGIDAPEGAFDVTITGLFEGPDRASCRTTVTVDGTDHGDTYIVVAGTRVWLGSQTGYQEVELRDPAALSALRSCPGHPNHWDLSKLHRLEVTDGEPVTVSGVNALRQDLATDPEALGAAGIAENELDDFASYELTVAAEGGWPIQLEVRRMVTVEAALLLFGFPTDALASPDAAASVYERLLLSRIDDPTISVDLPLLAG